MSKYEKKLEKSGLGMPKSTAAAVTEGGAAHAQ